MRYCFPALLLLAVLPLLNVGAAPAPEPWAILDIGPPRKGMTAEKYRQQQIDSLTGPDGILVRVWFEPGVKKLPSVAPLKDVQVCPWLTKNLRITEEEGGRHLRFTFRAGNRDEQVVILNALLRVYLRSEAEQVEFHERFLPAMASGPQLAKLLKEEKNPDNLKRLQKQAEETKARAADIRTEIARLKQVAVIKWAK